MQMTSFIAAGYGNARNPAGPPPLLSSTRPRASMFSRTGSRRSRSASTSSTRASSTGSSCSARSRCRTGCRRPPREAAAALGFAPIGAIERFYVRFPEDQHRRRVVRSVLALMPASCGHRAFRRPPLRPSRGSRRPCTSPCSPCAEITGPGLRAGERRPDAGCAAAWQPRAGRCESSSIAATNMSPVGFAMPCPRCRAPCRGPPRTSSTRHRRCSPPARPRARRSGPR